MITLQFCAFHGVIDSIIRWFSAGRVAHVDVVMPDGRLLGAQSANGMGGMPAGVWTRPRDYGDRWGMMNRVRVSMPTTPEQDAVFYAFLLGQIGRPYDFASIFGFLFGREWRDDSSWFCSELVTAALEYSGVVRTIPTVVSKITPQELLLMCMEIGTILDVDSIGGCV